MQPFSQASLKSIYPIKLVMSLQLAEQAQIASQVMASFMSVKFPTRFACRSHTTLACIGQQFAEHLAACQKLSTHHALRMLSLLSCATWHVLQVDSKRYQDKGDASLGVRGDGGEGRGVAGERLLPEDCSASNAKLLPRCLLLASDGRSNERLQHRITW